MNVKAAIPVSKLKFLKTPSQESKKLRNLSLSTSDAGSRSPPGGDFFANPSVRNPPHCDPHLPSSAAESIHLDRAWNHTTHSALSLQMAPPTTAAAIISTSTTSTDRAINKTGKKKRKKSTAIINLTLLLTCCAIHPLPHLPPPPKNLPQPLTLHPHFPSASFPPNPLALTNHKRPSIPTYLPNDPFPILDLPSPPSFPNSRPPSPPTFIYALM